MLCAIVSPMKNKYWQLKFLGEWRMPAEGVKLSGAGDPAGTRNGCDSGEARNRVPKGQGGELPNLSGKRTEGRYDDIRTGWVRFFAYASVLQND